MNADVKALIISGAPFFNANISFYSAHARPLIWMPIFLFAMANSALKIFCVSYIEAFICFSIMCVVWHTHPSSWGLLSSNRLLAVCRTYVSWHWCIQHSQKNVFLPFLYWQFYPKTSNKHGARCLFGSQKITL